MLVLTSSVLNEIHQKMYLLLFIPVDIQIADAWITAELTPVNSYLSTKRQMFHEIGSTKNAREKKRGQAWTRKNFARHVEDKSCCVWNSSFLERKKHLLQNPSYICKFITGLSTRTCWDLLFRSLREICFVSGRSLKYTCNMIFNGEFRFIKSISVLQSLKLFLR
jgi:hypothetical protein